MDDEQPRSRLKIMISFCRGVCDRSYVGTNKGLMLLLLWNTAIHACGYFLAFIFFFGLSTGREAEEEEAGNYLLNNTLLIVSAARCISYLLYPVAGLVGEVCWSKYNVMIIGTVLSFAGLLLGTPFLATATFRNCVIKGCSIDLTTYAIVIAIVGVFVYQFGLGLFEANAIQFGVDQLQFASNEKLQVFINWYFWHMYIAKLINIGVSAAIHFLHFEVAGKVIFMAPAVLLCTLLIPFVLYGCCMSSNPQQALIIIAANKSMNPVIQIYRVLRFVVSHNQPLCRSAFTYGEFPSRMDYAKQRFGGAFTTDEVEDVKAFCRILLVLLTLFGMSLQSDSNGFFSLFCMQYFVVIVWIPLHMLIIRPYCTNNSSRKTILPKIHLGLLLVVGYNIIMLIDNFKFWNPFEPLASLLYGCSFLLVYLSTLEFILAQAPRSMQGLLIGLWYSYQSFEVVFFCVASYAMLHKLQQALYTVSTILSILSLMLFQYASHWYTYRQRNELTDVNRQNIIEQYTERQLLRGQLLQKEAGFSSDDFSITIHTIQQ